MVFYKKSGCLFTFIGYTSHQPTMNKSIFSSLHLKLAVFFIVCFFLFLPDISFAQVIPPYIPPTGLLAWYPFNNNANDVTIYAHNGTAYGSVAYSTDRFGSPASCYQSSGNGLINIPVHNFPIGDASRSVCTFYKCSLPYIGSNRCLMNWGNNSYTGGRIGFYTSPTVIGVEYMNGAVYTNYTPDTSWHCIVFTYPATGGGSSALKLYIDGAIVTSPTILTPIGVFNTDTGLIHNIGGSFSYIPPFSNSWSGKLDDVGVWDRELTACEVYQIWKGTINFTPLISGGNALCMPGVTTLTTNVSGGSWTSSNPSVAGVVGGVVSGLSAGNSIITYTINNVCGIFSDTQMVSVAPLPNAGTISGPTNVCAGSAITLITTGTGGGWSSSNPGVAGVGGGTGVVNGLTIGTTIISYSLTNSCGTATDTQMVTVNPLPNAGTITGPSSICPGSSVTFNDPAPGGTWSSSNLSVVTIGSTTGIAGGGAVGTAIISYSVTNSCGTATDTQAVAVTLVPSAGTIIGPTSVCVGTNISLSNGTSGGTWTSGSLAVATVNSGSGIVGGVTSGTVIITYSLTNSCGTAIDTQSIVVSSLPVAGTISGATGLCTGTTISLANATPGGTWSSSNTSIATVSGSVIVGGVTAGTAIISYSVTNACGTVADTQAIIVNPLPDAGTISALVSSVCIGASISLSNSVTGGVWGSSNLSVATVVGSTGQLQALATGLTTITYTSASNAFGCTSYTVFPLTVTINGGNLINATVSELKCNGDNNGKITITVLAGSGSYQYIWSDGSTTALVNNLAAGAYTVIVKDMVTNCADTQSFNLVMPSVMSVESTSKNDICNSGNGNVSLVNVMGGTSPYSYLWSTGATTSGITSLSPGDYGVAITDKNLCTEHFTFSVAEDSCNTINIHNVITPNGDGINDAWVIEGINRYPGSTVQLFDKWGDLVFDAKNYNNDWTGGVLPDGSYFYLIKLNGPNLSGGKDIMTGNLLIKR